jgi:hypothetical protein
MASEAKAIEISLRWRQYPVVAHWVSSVATKSLRCWLPLASAAGALVLLAGWVPHYLTWPWWADTDQFAISALSWEAGIRPYRDLADFDFPGPIYVLWVLGKVFGWGKTAPYYAFDAALILLLGIMLTAWSRRLFGQLLPGLTGYVLVLAYYLSLDYSLVAQRDWQAAVGVVVAVLALQTWPGMAGRLTATLAVSFALAYRPQTVLFLPALFSALDQALQKAEGARARVLRVVGSGSLAFAVCLVVAFVPLLWSGLLGDFARALRVTHYGGPYNHVSIKSFLFWLYLGLTQWRVVGLLAAFGLLAAISVLYRRPAITWILVLLGAVVYKPLSPIAHSYLDQPLELVWPTGVAFCLGWALALEGMYPAARLVLAVAVIAGGVCSQRPSFFRPRASVRVLGAWVQGRAPGIVPPGSEAMLTSRLRASGVSYSWEDYQGVLDYLRRKTTPGTRVANFLRANPYPTVNGPVGRLTPFPSAAGVLWLLWVKPDDEAVYRRALERTGDTVVVWVPDEKGVGAGLELPDIQQQIRRLYYPEARFGAIEVWRRLPGSGKNDSVTVERRSRALGFRQLVH